MKRYTYSWISDSGTYSADTMCGLVDQLNVELSDLLTRQHISNYFNRRGSSRVMSVLTAMSLSREIAIPVNGQPAS